MNHDNYDNYDNYDDEDDLKKEERVLLKQDRTELNSLLSGGIRMSLSKNRLLVTDRIYVGFDTEYKTIDSTTNKILCYTTSTLTESFLKIRSDNIDFSLKDGSIHLPQTSELISTGVRIIRSIRNKKDFELNQLKNTLLKESVLRSLELYNHDFIFKFNSLDINEIKSSFFDLREDPTVYSFKKMLDRILNDQKHLQCRILKNVDLTAFNPTLKKECFLAAHFTTADVSLFHDFEEIKEKFTVINKSFLTLDKLINYKN